MTMNISEIYLQQANQGNIPTPTIKIEDHRSLPKTNQHEIKNNTKQQYQEIATIVTLLYMDTN